MTGQQLKNSILQWAIQGKLVPQIASEGTADDLLKEIRAEKEKLVKEGKLKKKDLEVNPIEEDEIPFEIPKGWRWCRLKEVFTMQAGKTINASELSQEKNDTHQYLCYGGNGIRGFINRYNTEGMHPIVGRQGALCGCINMANDKFHATEHAVVVYTYASTCEYWAYYFLIALNLNQYATATAQPGLSVANILETLIPIPPRSEQKRIVAKIEDLMPLVEQYGKAQEQLESLNKELPEKLKKSVLQEAIMGKLVPQDPNEGTADELLAEIRKEKEKLVKEGKLKKKDLEIKPIEEDDVPFEVPEGWRWCRFGEMITLLSGQDLTPDKYFDTPKGIPYITGASHFINGELTISRWTESPTSISHIGDLLITCKGTVGTMAYNKIGEVHIARQIMAINGYKIYLPYIQHFLEIEVPELEKKAHSIIPGISREVVLNTIIPLPPPAEQKRIVAKIEEVMGELDKMVEMMG